MLIRTLYDVIVVGAGSMGMSAGYHLAKQGVRTLLIDTFDPPHQEGSHHGEPRLIRHAYHGGPAYVSMALRAHKLWNELEDATESSLLVQSGVLNMSSSKVYSYEERLKDSLQFGVPIELLDADEIAKRWPGIRLPEDFAGMYEPEAGYLFSEKCVGAYRQLALAAGATLLPYTRVESIGADHSGVSVYTQHGVFHAEKAILSAGAWFKTLEPFITLPIQSVRKVVGWFQSESPLFDAGDFPGFTLGTVEGGFYGFPSIGGAGVKIGRHDQGVLWQPGEPIEPFGTYADDEADLRRALETYMPAAAGKLIRGAVCKYEMTPDEDFIIDHHPAYPNILLAGGFSGHGFKFSSVVGEILSDLIMKQETTQDISPFAISRFSNPV
ncbi:N-methyl-L-tryptophan oxidase [Paenibacillus sp. DS2015]|uniref:N-methyl-L-tryptophan oxidase n=1 Tax=Paenibacillus sp. DS2015 TaxID=3373917 RepID=UPI003D24D35B